MAKRYLPPGIDPPRTPERLGSPALAAQRRLISATGRAESEHEGNMKKMKHKVSAEKMAGMTRVKHLAAKGKSKKMRKK